MDDRTAFAANHAWDRNFFLLFVVICWMGVTMGFEPAVTARMEGRADYSAPWVLQIHAITFIGWLALLTLQVVLIRFRRFNVHRAMGLTGFVLIPVMVVSALSSEIISQRFYSVEDPENLRFFIYPIMTMLVFPVLAFAALGFRKTPASHKRLIVLATISIVGSGFFRWWGDVLEETFGTGYFGIIATFYTGYYVLLALVVAYDLITRKQIHPVYRYAVPVLVIIPFIVSGMYHSDWWPEVARRLAGL